MMDNTQTKTKREIIKEVVKHWLVLLIYVGIYGASLHCLSLSILLIDEDLYNRESINS